MEPNESGLSSYYHQQRHHQVHHNHHPQPPQQQQHHHHHQHHHQSPTTTNITSPTNGLLSNTHHANAPTERTQTPMVFPHSVPSLVSSPLETVKRKRGRPRKYGTTSDQTPPPKKTASSPSSSSPKKKDQSLGGVGVGGSSASVSSKKSQLVALGNAGQGFTPHVITVAAGEDVGQKIMLFMQQSKREICILSASGSISNASLRQPATSGGNITYEGRFDILSLSGSYVRTEIGGRTGGLSVCLSSADGQIIGGGVGGPLMAAGPVQVIVGTFQIDTKKDVSAGVKGDGSAGKLPSPVGGVSVSSAGFRSAVDSSGRIPVRGNDDHQNIGGSHFMIQPRGMHMTPSRSTDWRGGPDARSSASYEMTGRTGRGARQSPENGDYDQIAD